MRTARLGTVVWLAVASLAAGCGRRDEALVRRQAVELRESLAAVPADVGRDHDRTALWKEMQRFYEGRAYEPAWIDALTPTGHYDAAVAALEEAAADGLDPARYGAAELKRAREGADRGSFGRDRLEARDVVPLDVKLTWAWMRLAADLSAGAVDVEGPGDKLWRLRRRKVDFAKELADALQHGRIEASLRALAPSHPDYVRLREAYARYREIAKNGGWPELPASLTLREGARSPHVRTLAQRLAATDDLSDGAAITSDVFDRRLAEAVARFQRRHGLEADGVVGARVVAELNVPVDRRLRQIALNLERWRWLPRDLGDRYIFVNVPDYRLEVHEGDRIALAMNAIVGAKDTPTPIFSDTLTHIVFSPYWNVPDSIASAETLPAAQSDPEFLARHRIEIVGTSGQVVDPGTIDWTAMNGQEAFPYRFRQRPGSSNSLGLVKFVLPNEYDVYLHDTPADSLFTRTHRALSHGCVRIEQPVALAEYLLKDAPDWTPEKIRAAMTAGAEKTVTLRRPIAVHLMYWTARVTPDGVVHVRPDVYGRDAREVGPAPVSAAVGADASTRRSPRHPRSGG